MSAQDERSGGTLSKKRILMLPATGTGHISIPLSIGSLSLRGQHDFKELSNACEMDMKYVIHMLYTIQ